MPIVDINSIGGKVPSIQNGDLRVYRTTEEIKTSTLFDKDKSLDSIIQFVSGMDWTVDYFLQIRDINDTVQPPDVNVPATQQKYNRINKLILKLQSPISQDDPQNITGEAIINSGFIPNNGDAFLATLTGGRETIFVIDNIETKTYNLHEAYYVTFKLFTFLDNSSLIYNDLVNKTMKEYTYDSDHLLDFSAPIILASDYKKKIELKNVIPELIDYYIMSFTHPEKNLLALPTTSGVYVDTLLTDFLFKIIDVTSDIDIANMTRIDVDLSNEIKYTIWDAIIKRDIGMLKRAQRNIGFKYTPQTVSNVTMRHTSYLGINFVVGLLTDANTETVIDYVQLGDATSVTDKPIKIKDNSYVLSDNLYDLNLTGCGVVEELLVQYLKGEVIDSVKLDTLLSEYYMWDTIEQFYLIPLLIVFVKDTVNNTFTSL